MDRDTTTKYCCCGNSSTLGVVHRANMPCFIYEELASGEAYNKLYEHIKEVEDQILDFTSALRELAHKCGAKDGEDMFTKINAYIDQLEADNAYLLSK